MALATATITYNLADLTGVPHYQGTRVWATTNIDGNTIADTDGNEVRIGEGRGTINPDGSGEIVVWVPGTGSNPASWQTYIHVKHRIIQGPSPTKTFGPFAITASGDLADLIAEMPVQPEYEMAVLNRIDGVDDHGNVSGAVAIDPDISTHWLDATGPTVLTIDDAPSGGTRYVSILPISGASDITVTEPADTELTDGSFTTFAWVRGAWILAGSAGGSTADATAPEGGSVSYSGTADARLVSTTGWTDPEGLHLTAPYRFTLDGSTWTAWQAGTSYNYTSIPAGTYLPQAQARNKSGLSATATASGSFTVVETYRAAVLADSPDFYFPLDDAPGTTAPVNLGSLTASSLLVGAGITFGAAGLGDGATSAQFGTADAYIRLLLGSTYLSSSTSATLELLVHSTRGSTGGGADDGNHNMILLPSGTYGLNTFENIPAFGVNSGVNLDHWQTATSYHMAVTFDGANVRYYRNGTQLTVTEKTIPTNPSTGAVYIGSTDTLSTPRGRQAGVAMYSTVLSPARILAHAQAAGYA